MDAVSACSENCMVLDRLGRVGDRVTQTDAEGQLKLKGSYI
jgi:hypothetical protein